MWATNPGAVWPVAKSLHCKQKLLLVDILVNPCFDTIGGNLNNVRHGIDEAAKQQRSVFTLVVAKFGGCDHLDFATEMPNEAFHGLL
jgi:hypothetical protein